MSFQNYVLDSLQHHRLEIVEPYGAVGLYRCRSTQHKSRYSYNVILARGYCSVHGDIGAGTFLFQDDPIDWLKNLSYDSVDYVLSKLNRPNICFSEDKFVRNMEYLMRERPEEFKIIDTEWRRRTVDAPSSRFNAIWYDIWHECLPGQESLDCMGHDWADYWVAYALIVFARLFEGKPVLEKPRLTLVGSEPHHQGQRSWGPFPH